MDTIKMFWMMFAGLFSYWKYENKEEFWEWYWERKPYPKYPNETLWDEWDTFKYYASGQSLMWNVKMWFESHFNKEHWGYSWTFKKNGYFVMNDKFFIPDDGSFSHGCVAPTVERENGNPYFAKN